MTPAPNPWSDPSTPTQPGSPYLGPPPTAPHPYGYPSPYGGYPGYGYPGSWAPVPPRPPQRPGQVITTAVLAFVQAGVVLFASLYLWFIASVVDLAADGDRSSCSSSPGSARSPPARGCPGC